MTWEAISESDQAIPLYQLVDWKAMQGCDAWTRVGAYDFETINLLKMIYKRYINVPRLNPRIHLFAFE